MGLVFHGVVLHGIVLHGVILHGVILHHLFGGHGARLGHFGVGATGCGDQAQRGKREQELTELGQVLHRGDSFHAELHAQ